MKRPLIAVGLSLVLAPVSAGGASRFEPPRWLLIQQSIVLQRVFRNAKPRRVSYIPYPKKIAVVFEFDHVVRCAICSSPSSETQPRGRVVRVSFDRRTHQLGGASDGWAMRFCEVQGNQPPKSRCLRR